MEMFWEKRYNKEKRGDEREQIFYTPKGNINYWGIKDFESFYDQVEDSIFWYTDIEKTIGDIKHIFGKYLNTELNIEYSKDFIVPVKNQKEKGLFEDKLEILLDSFSQEKEEWERKIHSVSAHVYEGLCWALGCYIIFNPGLEAVCEVGFEGCLSEDVLFGTIHDKFVELINHVSETKSLYDGFLNFINAIDIPTVTGGALGAIFTPGTRSEKKRVEKFSSRLEKLKIQVYEDME